MVLPCGIMSTAPAITPDSRIGDLVAAQPSFARIFEKLGIDYCCGGRRSLAEAAADRGLAPDTLAVLLEATADFGGPTPEVDAAAMSLSGLIDHIEGTHHVYVRRELPRLVEMADRLSTKHGLRDPRLPEVADTVQALAAEMADHMRKEEQILFPLVRLIEQNVRDGFHCGSIANPIRVMEAEHESAGRALARLRELTDGFTPGADACNTHRAFLAGLAEFEQDLHRHVHKENNILFPRALAKANANN